jgi:hypothetical protein
MPNPYRFLSSTRLAERGDSVLAGLLVGFWKAEEGDGAELYEGL